jgi:hypothetical protein
MKDKITELKKAFCSAKTEDERAAIDSKMRELMAQDADKFSEAMVDAAKETSERANALAMKQKMKDVIPAISLVYIAKTYFNKSDTWLYQRINGNDVNGKPAAFTANELSTMRFALQDLSQRLGSLSVSL